MCHATADADRMQIMRDGVTASDYIAFLATVHGFEVPVALALDATPGLGVWIAAARQEDGRAQLRRLRADLAALGVADPADLPACPGIAPFASPATALGWLYVVERNTLVDGLVLRHLRPRLPAPLDRA
ncbi:MAG: hypothetical protein KIT31_22750, partial [Deltaproteobacteria bacterium]|nr:hypothetical protein [Deltaproteobacteria bacterium]